MKKRKKLLSQRHTIFYFLSIWEKRIRKRISWIVDNKKYTRSSTSENLDFRVKKHQSKLLKKLGETDMILQYNKIDNLKFGCRKSQWNTNKAW
jgi:vancomycin resistance protein VanW